jgi:uncharacterized coiled-coil DUF342 family protein
MIAIGILIYSIIKIFKQEKQIRDLQKDIHWNFNNMSDRFKETHQQIDNVYVNSRDMANTYTDMRIEKLEDKLTNNKKLLKG